MKTIARVGHRDVVMGQTYLNAFEAAALKQSYRAVCAEIGEGRWTGTTLVRVPALSR